MAKLTLSNLANLQNEQTAVNAINANSALIVTAMENTLSRNGTSPNQLGADLDINNNDILNVGSIDMSTGGKITGLGSGGASDEPVTVGQLTDFILGTGNLPGNLPVGGTANQLLIKSSSIAYASTWGFTLPGDYIFTGSPVFSGNVNFNGSTSGSITFKTQPVSGTFNFNLPTTAGTAGQVLTSQGGGSTAMTWSTLNTGFGGFSNPTGTVGLTATNGSATTAIRSDAAPAISQSITPIWTGLHTFLPTSGAAIYVASGSSSTPVQIAVGRATPDYIIAVSAGSSSYFTGDVAGDGIIRHASNFWIGAVGFPGIKVNTSGALTFPQYSTGILHSNSSGAVTSSAISLSSADVTDTLPVNRGGTNASTSADALTSLGAVPLAGGTMSGALILFADPSVNLGAATKQYVDAISSGIQVKPAVAAATTANITLSGEQTIDTVVTSASLVLVKNQTAPKENGIYTSGAGAWVRITQLDTWSEAIGAQTFVSGGSANINKVFTTTVSAGGTIDVTSMPWVQTNTSLAYTAGSGLTLASTQFSIAAGAITSAMLAGSISATKFTGTDIATVGTLTTGSLGSGFTMAGSLLATAIALPSVPATGKASIFVDSTTHTIRSIYSDNTISTTVVADTGASNNFLTAISSGGVISKAQPTFSNLATGTAPAFTLGGTVSGGGQLINNIGGLTINPTASSTNKGIFITQSGAGSPVAGSGDFLGYAYNQIKITDNIVAAPGGALSYGLYIDMTTNGSSGTGGSAIYAQSTITGSASSSAVVPIGITALAQADVNYKGGTALSPAGSVYGISVYSRLIGSNLHFDNVTGGEINYEVYSNGDGTTTVSYVSGLQIVANDSHQIRGTTYDAGLSFSSKTNFGQKTGILFSNANGFHPVYSGGTLIETKGSATITNGIDFSTYTISGNAFKSPGFYLTGVGTAHFSFVTALGAGFWLGSATTGADRFFFGSDAVSADVFRVYSQLGGVNVIQVAANATSANTITTVTGRLHVTALPNSATAKTVCYDSSTGAFSYAVGAC